MPRMQHARSREVAGHLPSTPRIGDCNRDKAEDEQMANCPSFVWTFDGVMGAIVLTFLLLLAALAIVLWVGAKVMNYINFRS